MNLERILRLLTILQIISFSQNSHVQRTSRGDLKDFTNAAGPKASSQRNQHHHDHHYNYHHRQQRHRVQRQRQHSSVQHVHRWPPLNPQNRWSGRRKSFDKQLYTAWTLWSGCGSDCVRRRERYCKVKRKCGHTKQLEEQACWSCQPPADVAPSSRRHHGTDDSSNLGASDKPTVTLGDPQTWPQRGSFAQPVVMHRQVQLPVLQEVERGLTEQVTLQQVAEMTAATTTTTAGQRDDFYIISTKKPNYKKKRRPIYIDVDDYADLEVEEVEDEWHRFQPKRSSAGPTPKKVSDHPPVHSLHTRRQSRKHASRFAATQRDSAAAEDDDDGIDGDVFQYEDFDFEAAASHDQYSDSYEEAVDYGAEFRNVSTVKERATPDALIPRHRRIYSKWSRWTKCSPKCTTRRYKKCRLREHCGREVLREIAYCYTEGSFCQQWLQAQVQKSSPFDLRPVATSQRREISLGAEDPQSNAIVSDFIMNGRGYRGPEYTPLKLKCGTAAIHKRHMYNMLKIIGGKAARKGEWPWQVAIFNRFKEAFCGGTLIAPQWVLTAAHCVRKVLYVRLGEHNLDHDDGTELQLRVLRSYKHPNFDKKTVDSDVALLRLPKSTNTSTWIGFSCLPRPFQPLPRNVDCTVIGWGKRRNRDVAGTSVLHQAEVPIIPMENCRSVYHDYTITKNMFCAGHKRGRIDTCAGDSGGPLLCRDTTKPNHPWTIFGITSFGDGCAKRNKFGIYAKVPNYVDWAWSVINCNGNCKLHQRS